MPKSLKENLLFRKKLLLAAKEDRELRAGIMAACKQDIIFWIDAFAYQFNPNPPADSTSLSDRMGPFIAWDFQERLLLDRPDTTGRPGILWCVEKQRGAVHEKSREMGISWLYLLVEMWLCTFHPYYDCLNISRSKEAVDNKSKKSLFAKLRFLLENMPDWMKGEVDDTESFLNFANTKSEITGEATTSKAGVGGRGSPILIDEFAEIREDKAVREKTAQTGGCRFFVSTHLGVSTEFYKLTTNPEYIKFVTHWVQHPKKNHGLYSWDETKHKVRFWKYDTVTGTVVETENTYDYGPNYNFVKDGSPTGGAFPGIRSPWYDYMALVEIADQHGVAMQLDIDPKGAARQFFDAILIARLKRQARQPDFEGVLDYDERGYPHRLTPAPGGPVKLWVRLDQDGNPPRVLHGGGVDVSGGRGKTPSCFTLTNAVTGAKVLEYANARIEPRDFATLVVSLCRLFVDEKGTTPKIAWENQGPGGNFGQQVLDLGYTNFYRKKSHDKIGRPNTETIGWNPVSMAMMLRDYHLALSKGEFENPSEAALDECLSFEHDGRGGVTNAEAKTKDAEDAHLNHGDRVVADGLSWMICKDLGRLTTQKALKQTLQDKDPVAFRRTMAYRFQLELAEREDQPEWEHD